MELECWIENEALFKLGWKFQFTFKYTHYLFCSEERFPFLFFYLHFISVLINKGIMISVNHIYCACTRYTSTWCNQNILQVRIEYVCGSYNLLQLVIVASLSLNNQPPKKNKWMLSWTIDFGKILLHNHKLLNHFNKIKIKK